MFAAGAAYKLQCDTAGRLSACYSDIPRMFTGRGLDLGAVPYRDVDVEYPVGMTELMWFSAVIARMLSSQHSMLSFEIINMGALLIALCATVIVLKNLAFSRRMFWSLSPALFTVAAVNWDLLAVLCLCAFIRLS